MQRGRQCDREAQPTNTVLTRVPHKPLTGSPGIRFEPVFHDRVSQAGVDSESQGLPSGAVPVPRPTSEPKLQDLGFACSPERFGEGRVPEVVHQGQQYSLVPTGACSDSGVSKAPVQRKRPSQDATDSPNKRSVEAQVLGEEERLVSTDSRTGDSPQGALPREGAGVGSQEQTQQASKEEAASQEEGWEGHPKPKQVKGAVPEAA